MSPLKNYLAADLNVFLNFNEFAEIHNIDGIDIPAVVDSDILKVRSNNKSEQYEGVYAVQMVVFVKALDMAERPVYGQFIHFDGKPYMVMECTEDMGILEITLGANES